MTDNNKEIYYTELKIHKNRRDRNTIIYIVTY